MLIYISQVKSGIGILDSFKVNVGVNQGSTLSPFLDR